MELLKILGGLAVIAVIVVAVGVDKGEEQAAAPKEIERSFSSGDSSARFVSVGGD